MKVQNIQQNINIITTKSPNFCGNNWITKSYNKTYSYLPDTFNPVMRYCNLLFERSLIASRRRFQPLIPEIESFSKEVPLNISKNSQSYALDINKDNRQKYLIVLHGSSQNITNNQALYKNVINKTDFAVLAPEYRGFGKNAPHKITQESILEDTTAALNYLLHDKKISPENIYVLGHSFGGFAATQLVKNNKKLGRLILISSIDSLSHEAVNFKQGFRNKIPKSINFLFRNFKILRTPLAHVFNTNKNLRAVNIPVDIVHAKNDKLVNIESAQMLSKVCKNLHSITTLPTGGHTFESTKIQAVVDILNK